MKAQLIETGLYKKKHFRVKKVDQYYLDVPFHFHESCELVLIEESFGKRVIGDHIGNFQEGDLVLMGPNLPHVWLNDSIFYRKIKGNEVKAVVIYFSSSLLMELADETDLTQTVGELIHRAQRGIQITGETRRLVAQELSRIHLEEGFKKISAFFTIIDMLNNSTDFKYLASEGYTNSYSHNDTERFNNVYQHLVNNFHREISLNEVAGIAKMSPNAFCRYFKKRTQKSLVRFINELRIGHACKLLQTPEYSVSDVSYECGFNNLVNFNKCFKNITQKTPGLFRKEIFQL